MQRAYDAALTGQGGIGWPSVDEIKRMDGPATLEFLMDFAMAGKDRTAAMACATAVAGYHRPKLSSADVTVRNDDARRSSAELQAELDALHAKVRSVAAGVPSLALLPAPRVID